MLIASVAPAGKLVSLFECCLRLLAQTNISAACRHLVVVIPRLLYIFFNSSSPLPLLPHVFVLTSFVWLRATRHKRDLNCQKLKVTLNA